MKEFSFNYQFSPIPPIMKRGRHVLIVVKDETGRYVLGSKKVYPEGISRFIGGGIDLGEDPRDAAVRETEEELKVSCERENFEPLAKFTATVSDKEETFIFETFLFLLTTPLNRQQLLASDDLDDLVELTKEEILELGERYKNLPNELVDLGGNKGGPFRWSDYGKFYAEVHRVAIEMVK